MKNIALAVALSLLALPSFPQNMGGALQGPIPLVFGTGAPSGSCVSPNLAVTTVGLYDCIGGSWVFLAGSGSTPAFSSITGGTNTSAAMLVGNGSSLGPTGTGTVTANIVPSNGTINGLPVQEAVVTSTAWNNNWLSSASAANSLGASGNQVARWVHLGDSISQVCTANGGLGPSNCNNVWPIAMENAFQSIYGNAGTGVLPVQGNFTAISYNWTVSSGYNFYASYGPYSPAISLNGSTAAVGGVIELDNGATAVFQRSATPGFYGKTAYVYSLNCSDTSAWTVSVDGVPQGSFGGSAGSCTPIRTQVYNGTLGYHVLTITAPVSGKSRFYAGEWLTGLPGIIIDNLAIGGTTTQYAISGLPWVYLIPNVGLVSIMHGFNDFSQVREAPAGFATNIGTLVTGVQTNFPGASTLLINEYTAYCDGCTDGTSGYTQQQYQTALLNYTQANSSVGYVSIEDSWGTNANAAAQGLVATGDHYTHPTDKGGTSLFEIIAKAQGVPLVPVGTAPGAVASTAYGAYASLPSTCATNSIYFFTTGLFEKAICQSTNNWSVLYGGFPVTNPSLTPWTYFTGGTGSTAVFTNTNGTESIAQSIGNAISYTTPATTSVDVIITGIVNNAINTGTSQVVSAGVGLLTNTASYWVYPYCAAEIGSGTWVSAGAGCILSMVSGNTSGALTTGISQAAYSGGPIKLTMSVNPGTGILTVTGSYDNGNTTFPIYTSGSSVGTVNHALLYVGAYSTITLAHLGVQ